MHDTELVMKYHSLGPQGMKAIATPLEVRPRPLIPIYGLLPWLH